MASLILPLAAGSTKADGTVNAGGRVYLYSPGTSIAIDAYADRDKSALATRTNGYYLLDPAGRAYLWTDVPCTVREETSGGTLVKEYPAGTDVNAGLVEVINDGFTGTASDGSIEAGERTYLDSVLTSLYETFGGTDGKYLLSAGATQRLICSWMAEVHVSVKDFGAVGNNAADDTSAIQAAINAAAAGGRLVFFPPGTYRISSALIVPAGGMRIVGASAKAVTIKQMSTTANGFTVTPTDTSTSGLYSYTYFDGVNLTCNTTSSGTAVSSLVSGLLQSKLVLQDVTVDSAGGRVWASAVVNTTSGGTTDIFNSALFSSGTCVSGGSVFASFSTMAGTPSLSTSGSVYLVRCTVSNDGGSTALSGAFYAAASTVSGTTNLTGTTVYVAASQLGTAVSDQRTGSPIAFSVGSTSSVTPLPDQTAATRINATAGGITVTINAPSAPIHGHTHKIICMNSSGGAVTWTFNAVWHTSGAVAPATGNRVVITFVYDAVSAIWSEDGRATSAN